MGSRENIRIKSLFRKLAKAKLRSFPEAGERLDAPDEQGVYVIYSPRGKVLHVGRTYRGTRGLRQRLNNHLHASSSFTNGFLKGRGARLRAGYTFSLLAVPEPRQRALLEALAIGSLCPAHLGVSKKRPVTR
jgi:hypothetical protein